MARREPRDLIALYEEAKNIRSPHENDWRLAAAHVLPSHYTAWQTNGPASYQQSNEATRRIAYDTTGARSLPKYVAILERLATPVGQQWHSLTPSDPSLRRHMRVKAYFDQLKHLLFKYRYNPRARFRTASNEIYTSMGTYGNGPMYLGLAQRSARNPYPTFRYIATPFRDTFILVDDEGDIVHVFRRFWLNVRQFKAKFPKEKFPHVMEAEAKKPSPSETSFFEFVHHVSPRDDDDYDPNALDSRRHPFVGSYVCVSAREYVGDETGFRSMPYKMPRTSTAPGNPYGFSPAVMALGALGGASTMKKTHLKQGNKAVDPVLLAHDDGVLNGEVDLRPGAVNYGAVDKQGRALIQPMRTGDFRVAETLIADDRRDIEDSFFVTLFQILQETPEMTATEVMERVAEKASLLSPTMGRLQSEMLGPMIEREIDLLTELGVMPEMPPELIEAQGEYEVVYTSPMAKGQYAEEVSGFMRAVEFALRAAEASQDPGPIDHFNFDAAIPEIADHMSTPARWMHDDKAIKAKRQQRQESMAQAQAMQNASGLASAAKVANEMGQQ